MPKLNFVPSEHVVVGYMVKGEIPLDADFAKMKERMMNLLRPWDGTCWRCGHWLKYVIVTKHLPTSTHRALGEDCCEHLLSDDDEYQLRMLHEVAKRGEAEVKNREYRFAFKQTHPEIYAMLESAKDDPGDHLDFVADVARRFFGPSPFLSDKQVDALDRCLKGRQKFERNKALRKAMRPETAVVPIGKGVEIVGQVVKVDVKENDYGFRTVMTVKTREDWLVWGTVPAALDGVKVDDWVKFTANTEASDGDEAFGFFKRPRKAEKLNGAPEEPVTECVKCGGSLEDVFYNNTCADCREVPF